MMDFHFLRPWFLLLLPLVILALVFWLKSRLARDGWQHSCDKHLLQAMQLQESGSRSLWHWLYWPISILTVVAMAGPAFREVPMPVMKNQSALVVVLDLSKSMLSDDIKPSRLQRAKFKIKDILNDRKDGQTALIAYAGEPFIVTPLTDDTATINELLNALDPDIMPVSGSSPDKALQKAGDLLKQAGVPNGDILLITDGIESAQTSKVAKDLAEQGFKTSVLAVATKQGAPIPTRQGFLKDSTGKIVVPKLEESALMATAESGSGIYQHINHVNMGMESWLNRAAGDQPDSDKNNDESNRFKDEGPWLLFLVAILTAFLFRKGLLLMVFLLPILPEPSFAAGWKDWWYNPDQRAWEALQKKQPEEALEIAEDDVLKALAAYQKGEFDKSVDLFRKNDSDTLEYYYNQGNALAQSGQLQAALDSYQKALEKNPDDEDTQYNKKIVEDALKQNQEQQSQSDQNEKDQQNDEESQEKSDQSEENSQQQNADGEQPDQQSQHEESQQMSEHEQAAEQKEQQQQAQSDESKEAANDSEDQQSMEPVQEPQADTEKQSDQEMTLTPEEMALDAEEEQAMEQWLRRIKDDPGGLLRRKFLYQYYRKNPSAKGSRKQEDW